VRRQSSAGWLLVGLIVLISAVILALVGITFYLTEHLRTTSLRQNQTRAIYLAQAGVMRETYDFRSGNGVSLTETTVTAGPPAGTAGDDVYQISGPEADSLLVNFRAITVPVSFPTGSLCSGTRDRMQDWTVRNVRAGGQGAIRVDQMRIAWSPGGGEGVLRIDLDGAGSDWTAPCGSPAGNGALIDIPNQTLNPGARWATNRIWFTSSAMEAKDWIEVTFIMRLPGDGSQRVARLDLQNSQQTTADFTLRSLGTVRRGAFPFSVWRRMKAELRACAFVSGAACNSEGEERTQQDALVSLEELFTLTP
jgi:hypothetical protein